MTTFSGHPDVATPMSQSSTRPWLLLVVLTAAATADAINSTILVIARGHVMGGIHATPDEVAWLNMAYLAAKLTAFAAAVWLGQYVASGRLIVGSTALLMISSLGCAATSDLTALVAWRIIQGAAGAALLVSSQLVLFDVFPRRRQGIVQAVFAFSTIMAPTTIAPALQGWIVDNASWSWIFVVNLPLGLCGLLACRIIPVADANLPQSPPRRFDWIGVVLLAIAMTSIVFVTQEGSRYNWFDEPEIAEVSLLAGLATVGFLAWQVVRQRRGSLIDFAVFRSRQFTFGFIVSFVAGCALSGSAFLVPAFATSVLGLSPTYAGLLLLPSGLMVCAGLLVAGTLIQLKDLDPTKTIPFGIICFMTAMWMLAGSNSESGLPDMAPALLLRGLGLGLLFVSLTLVTLGGLDRRVLPQGIALFNIGRQIGGQIGIAWLTTYLDHQNALNRTVLSQYISVGNRELAERQEALGSLLTARGYEPDGAAQAATAFIQKTFAQQVATLSFNECFLAIALLFIVATPTLMIAKLALSRE